MLITIKVLVKPKYTSEPLNMKLRCNMEKQTESTYNNTQSRPVTSVRKTLINTILKYNNKN